MELWNKKRICTMLRSPSTRTRTNTIGGGSWSVVIRFFHPRCCLVKNEQNNYYLYEMICAAITCSGEVTASEVLRSLRSHHQNGVGWSSLVRSRIRRLMKGICTNVKFATYVIRCFLFLTPLQKTPSHEHRLQLGGLQ